MLLFVGEETCFGREDRTCTRIYLAFTHTTGTFTTNFSGKAKAAMDALEKGCDYVYIHMEAPDECGHMGDAELKKRAIELFDQRIVAPVLAALEGQDATIVITCDHFTPIVRRTHTEDAVPFLVYRTRSPRASGPAVFDESTAQAAGLFLNEGQGLLPFCLDQDA